MRQKNKNSLTYDNASPFNKDKTFHFEFHNK